MRKNSAGSIVVSPRFATTGNTRKLGRERDFDGMSTTTSSIASVLNSLIETCKDGQYGFQSAAETVKNADFKSLFSELSLQRQEFVGELQGLVRGLGEDTEKSGSLAGTLHRGWIDIKAALSSGDE